MTVVALVLVGAVVLFITEKLSVDLVSLLIIGVLLLTGILTPTEAFSGFADEATITVVDVSPRL